MYSQKVYKKLAAVDLQPLKEAYFVREIKTIIFLGMYHFWTLFFKFNYAGLENCKSRECRCKIRVKDVAPRIDLNDEVAGFTLFGPELGAVHWLLHIIK